MKNPSPIYNLLHQEIKACADHLLELGQKQDYSVEREGSLILGRLSSLLQFSLKMHSDEHYHPLDELKSYLEHTMLHYQDDQKRLLTIRLSEAISLLGIPSNPEIQFKPSIVESLMMYLVWHFYQDVKPGRALFRQLNNIKKINS